MDNPGVPFEPMNPVQPDREKPEPGALMVAVDTYHFSRGEARSLAVLDRDPSTLLEQYGRQIQSVLLRGWAEFFWILSLPALFITTMLQTITRWVLLSGFVPLIIVPIQQLGDHFFKPLLVTLHDSLIQPCYTLEANSMTNCLLVARPLSEILTLLVKPLATLLGSIRLVHITYNYPAGEKSRQEIV